MDELQSKLKELQAQYEANADQIKTLQNTIRPLEDKDLSLRNEIQQTNEEFIRLSGDLQEHTKEELFHDFNKINKLIDMCDYQDTFSIKLKCLETTEPNYRIDMSGDIKHITVTITTGSNKIMDIIRKCFTNDDYDDDNIKKMNETCWYKHPYFNNDFTYNRALAKSLLCPDSNV
jgi:predicted nuclease with TOPRIM domain